MALNDEGDWLILPQRVPTQHLVLVRCTQWSEADRAEHARGALTEVLLREERGGYGGWDRVFERSVEQLTSRDTASHPAYLRAMSQVFGDSFGGEVEWIGPRSHALPLKRGDRPRGALARGLEDQRAEHPQRYSDTTGWEWRALRARAERIPGATATAAERAAVVRETHAAVHRALAGLTTGDTIPGCPHCRAG